MLKKSELPETLQVPSYVAFHNLERQNTGLVGVKTGFKLEQKYQREFLCAKI